jgi:hypothetical protein
VGDLNTLIDHLTRRMGAARMEGFIPTIGEGYGMENALTLVRHMPGARQPRPQQERATQLHQ